jgi:hypothetical protein
MTLKKARPGRRRTARGHTIDLTRNTSRYLVTSYRGGREAVEINTTDRRRAQQIARSTAEAGVLAVLHEHVTHQGWKPVRRFEPQGGGA